MTRASQRASCSPNVAFLLAATSIVQHQCAHMQRLMNMTPEKPWEGKVSGGDGMMALFDPNFPRESITPNTPEGAPLHIADWGEATDALVLHWLTVWNLQERNTIEHAMHGKQRVIVVEFEKDGRLKRTTSNHLYYITHYVLLRTEYGTRSINSFTEADKDLLLVLESAFDDVLGGGKIARNHEEAIELAICCLLLSWKDPTRPACVRKYLQRMRRHFEPQSADDVTFYHTHWLIAHWLALETKHELYHAWQRFVPAYKPWPSHTFLHADGFTQLSFQHPPIKPTWAGAGVLRLMTKATESVEGDLELKSTEELLALRDRIMELLPNAELEAGETYLRMKPAVDSTVLHADYFHFRRESMLFPLDADDVDIPCIACGVDDGHELLLCSSCGRGTHPWCEKPRVHRLPEGNWLCEACHRVDLDFYIVWVPLHDLFTEHSVLTVAAGSHCAHEWSDRITEDIGCPADLDLSRVHSGPLKYGTAIMFNVKTVHGSTSGMKPRASLDFRVRTKK